MNQADRLDRDLTAWFVDTAMPHMPDYVDDILDQTEQIRQRPRWTFATRWLPAVAVERILPRAPRLAWRTIAIVALLALLAAAIVYVGSRPRVPSPFGLAANGLFVYSDRDDLFLLEYPSKVPRPLTSGPVLDTDPRWSLDGTRISFLREQEDDTRLMVVDLAGHEIATSE